MTFVNVRYKDRTVEKANRQICSAKMKNSVAQSPGVTKKDTANEN